MEEIRFGELEAQVAELLPDRVEMRTTARARRRSAAAAASADQDVEQEGNTSATANGGGNASAEGHFASNSATAVAANEANNGDD